MVSQNDSAATTKATAELPDVGEPGLSDPRYRLERVLGRGGMATVFEALDRTRDRRVALKRLHAHADPVKRTRNAELFELEFHTLAQLAHPRIVEVYDFGLDPSGPFYTMELLDGGDLQQLAPLPWRVGAIARDVCSALSLLHSRRLIHRDVSPRNVRRTEAGTAKLIDFGALAVMGPNKLLVGTPTCCAPESVHFQALDGRTDLYALGATLYYMLVGHAPYAAHSFAVLREAWQHGFPPPSAFVKDVPAALDALVVELLRLEPDARPASAAEVAQRLAAIDGAAPSAELQIARAYLTTPVLVGRGAEQARVLRRLKRTLEGHGRSIAVEGPPGVGRSRFLDAAALEASVLGLASVRADAEDAPAGRYGVAAAVARRVLELAPDVARETAQPHLAVLATLVPELAPSSDAPPVIDAGARSEHAMLAEAFVAWFKAIAARRPLVIAIDDFHRIDEGSALLFAKLGADLDEHRVCLLVSAQIEAGAPPPVAFERLLEASSKISLRNLSHDDTTGLLASLFGELPKLASLAHRVHALSAGNPRDVMRLAQHLIDSQAIRYADGAWSLAADLDQLALPRSMAQAMQARVAALRDAARELAFALALCPDQKFTLSECAALCDAQAAAELRLHLEALNQAELIGVSTAAVGLANSSWVPILKSLLPAERKALLHQRLAEVFKRRGDEFRAGSQWLQGSQTARALDALVPYAEAAVQLATRVDAIRSGLALFRAPPPDWFETYVDAIAACDALGRPPKHKYLLLSRMVAVCALYDVQDREHAAMLLEQLRRDSGLADYAELADAPPQERLKLALTRTQERFQSAPEDARVLDPLSAIRELARALGSAISMVTRAMDREWLRSLPDLSPLAPLAPSLRVLALAVDALDARLGGRLVHAHGTYEALLEIMERPDRAGMDPTAWMVTRNAVVNVLGWIDAGRGLGSCLARAQTLAENPAFEVNALVIRMLHAQFNGDRTSAEFFRRQIENLQLQNGSRQMFEGGHLVWELDAHVLAEDLTSLRHVIDQLIPLAQKYPGWVPVLRCACAELQRICGASQKALTEIEAALALAKPGQHQVWASAAACEVRTLIELGRMAEARAKAEAHVASAAALTGEVPAALQLLHALAAASTGPAEDASAAAEHVITGLLAQGVSGLPVGHAYELRARIALAQGDRETFDRCVEQCSAVYLQFKNPALRAKLQRLRDVAAGKHGAAAAPRAGTPESISAAGRSRVAAMLGACRDAATRATLALTLILRESGAQAGFLFSLTPLGTECAASIGTQDAPAWLAARVREYLEAERGDDETVSKDSEADPSRSVWADESGNEYRPVLLNHHSEEGVVVTGLAAVAMPKTGEFVYPADVASAISRHLAQSGDTSMLTIESS